MLWDLLSNTTIYDLVWNYALNHMNSVYFTQTQFITNHNRLSTQQDQTHCWSITRTAYFTQS